MSFLFVGNQNVYILKIPTTSSIMSSFLTTELETHNGILTGYSQIQSSPWRATASLPIMLEVSAGHPRSRT